MGSCFPNAVINSVPRFGKYINKLKFYRKCPTRRVKDTKIYDIENTSCVKNVMRVTPFSRIEREPRGATIILRGINYRVYIFTCSVRSDEYKYKTKHAFVFDNNFKPLHQSICCGSLIDNRADAHICVIDDKERETNINLRYALKDLFGGHCTAEYVYKIIPCE